jgi:hypothetical protein
VISLHNRGELLAPAIALSFCAAVAIVIGSAFARRGGAKSLRSAVTRARS